MVSGQSSVVRCKEQRTASAPQFLKLFARHLVFLFPIYVLLSTTSSSFPASGLYEVREIKPKVFVWISDDVLDQDGDPQFSRAGNTGFILTQDGVVVVDTTNGPVHARELLYEIRRRTDLPIKWVIDTSSHGEHTLGNEVFVDQQAVIFSTTAAESELRQYKQELTRRLESDWRLQARMRGFHVTLPSRTFDGEMSLVTPDQEIKMIALGAGPSEGDTMVYLPRSRVVFLGDLFENKYVPRIGSRDLRRWMEILAKVETWDADTYVPGHGAPGTKNDVKEFRSFLEWLSNEVGNRIRQGKSLTQVKSELIPFANYPWAARELAPEAVEGVYQQLSGTDHPGPPPDVAAPK